MVFSSPSSVVLVISYCLFRCFRRGRGGSLVQGVQLRFGGRALVSGIVLRGGLPVPSAGVGLVWLNFRVILL